MHKRIVVVGFTLILAAFAILMFYDSELTSIVLGSPQMSQPPSQGSSPGPQQFQQMQMQTRPQSSPNTTYFRLTAYLIGIAGVVITSLGIALESRGRESSAKPSDISEKTSLNEVVLEGRDIPRGELREASVKIEKDPPQAVAVPQDRMPNGEAAIQLNSVVKTYAGDGIATPALQGISLQVSKGEFVAIVGPSGCGKSSLLNMVGALDRPTSGKVLVDGVDISKLNDVELAEFRNRKIGFIFQSFNLIPRMTAVANVEYPLAARNISPRQRRKMALKVLQLVGLSSRASQTPSKMSGGEQQRVAIARALVTEPEILLGDEFTGNLDTKNTRVLTEMVRQLNKTTGKTVVVITHNMEVASAADRIIHLRDGQIERMEYVGKNA